MSQENNITDYKNKFNKMLDSIIITTFYFEFQRLTWYIKYG